MKKNDLKEIEKHKNAIIALGILLMFIYGLDMIAVIIAGTVSMFAFTSVSFTLIFMLAFIIYTVRKLYYNCKELPVISENADVLIIEYEEFPEDKIKVMSVLREDKVLNMYHDGVAETLYKALLGE